MYAIAFDLGKKALEEHYSGNTPTQGYADVGRFLKARGFDKHPQGSVYFGNDTVNAVNTVLTVQQLAAEFPWFVQVVKDIRMLRIEENNDLLDAVKQGAAMAGHAPKSPPAQLDLAA